MNDVYDMLFSQGFGKLGAAVMREIDGKNVKVLKCFNSNNYLESYNLYVSGIKCDGSTIIKFVNYDGIFQIKGLTLPHAEFIPDDFIDNKIACRLESVSLPRATKIGHRFLTSAPSLVNISIPKVREIGTDSLSQVPAMLEFNAPNLQIAYQGLLNNANRLQTLNVPVLEKINYDHPSGDGVSFGNLVSLRKLNAPKLQRAGYSVFQNNDYITKVDLPGIERLPSMAFYDWPALREINLPNMTECLDYVLNPKCCKNLQIVNAPKLVEAGIDCHPLIYEAIRKNKENKR